MLASLRAGGALSRAEIARRADLSLPTVAAIVRALEADGLVRLAARQGSAGSVGRPSPIVELNPDGVQVLALDVGATVTRAAVVNLLGRPVREAELPTPAGEPHAAVPALVAMVRRLVRWSGGRGLRGTAVGVPGYVTSDRRTLRLASNLPGWRDVALADELEAAIGLPCVLDNDVNMAAIGEGVFGAASGVRDFVFVDLGTGIGAGVVIEGRLHRGAHGLGGELSLAAYADAGGEERSIECQSAGWALTRVARELGYADVPALFRASQAADADAQAVLLRASATLALAVANMCAVVDPELVVVGGGLARGSDVFLDAMRRTLRERLPNAPKVIRTVLAERAAVLGAGAVALDWFSGVPIFAGGVAG